MEMESERVNKRSTDHPNQNNSTALPPIQSSNPPIKTNSNTPRTPHIPNAAEQPGLSEYRLHACMYVCMYIHQASPPPKRERKLVRRNKQQLFHRTEGKKPTACASTTCHKRRKKSSCENSPNPAPSSAGLATSDERNRAGRREEERKKERHCHPSFFSRSLPSRKTEKRSGEIPTKQATAHPFPPPPPRLKPLPQRRKSRI